MDWLPVLAAAIAINTFLTLWGLSLLHHRFQLAVLSLDVKLAGAIQGAVSESMTQMEPANPLQAMLAQAMSRSSPSPPAIEVLRDDSGKFQ